MWRFHAVSRAIGDVFAYLLQCVMINLVWAAMSLTIILMPAATAALFEVARLAEAGERPALAEFFTAFWGWLIKGWIWGAAVVLWLSGSLTALGFYASQSDDVASILLGISVVVAFILWATLFYFWSYMALERDPSIWRSFRNAFLTTLADPVHALVTAGFALLLIIVGALFIVPVVLLVPVLVAFISVYSLKAWLIHHDVLKTDENSEAD
jgi:hypothetical protein